MIAFAACLHRGAVSADAWYEALASGLSEQSLSDEIVIRECFPTATIEYLRSRRRSQEVHEMLLTGSEDKTARFWNMSTGKEHGRYSSDGVYSCACFSADGEYAYATNWDKKVRIWKRPFSEPPVELSYDDSILDLALLPDGLQFVMGTLSGDVFFCDAKTGEIIKRFLGHKGPVKGVAVVDSGKRILSASHDRTIRLWDVESGRMLRTFKGHTAAVNEIEVLPGDFASKERKNMDSYTVSFQVKIRAPKPIEQGAYFQCKLHTATAGRLASMRVLP